MGGGRNASGLSCRAAVPVLRTRFAGIIAGQSLPYIFPRRVVSLLSEGLRRTNDSTHVVEEQAAAGNPTALAADVARLRTLKTRQHPEIVALCDEYLKEKAAKAMTEEERITARAALDAYREGIFPAYQTAINIYLRKFGAGFRIDKVSSANTRGGSSCTYDMVINDVPIAGGNPPPGNPSFRNTLSSGDRNTLALAFSFASLDQDRGLASKAVVIDDPLTSPDEHRSLTTVQEVRALAEKAGQVIVLSHSQRFLCQIWEGADRDARASMEIVREGAGSTIRGCHSR
jgi:wobble nucleotide-excising tRNase